MLFDVNNLFFHAGSAFALTSGEYMSLVGQTASCAGLSITLSHPEDLGIGDGEAIPQIAVLVGTGITCTCQSLKINAQLQGATQSTGPWTTFAESGALSTASYVANNYVLPIAIPRRPSGIALPSFYRLNLALTGNGSSESLTTGTLLGGIVLNRDDATDTIGQYGSGFTVA